MSLYKPNITKTSPADRKKLERASALALPTNPTARGMTADQIKAALWIPIFGSDVSLLKELDRVVDAVNSYLLHLYTFLENGVPGAGGSDTESVKVHNTDPASHADIRIMIQEISNRLQAIADSDDISLDQLSEIVAFIKDNKTLIERITTEKVNVSDIIDDLETNLSNKPLSAKQGVVLQKQITDLEKEKLNASELDPAIADALLRANEAIAQHNTSDDAHADIRLVLSTLSNQLQAIADSDDDTLNQMSEIVAFIKNNKTLIENITTSKVNVSDIIDNLITSATNKPLSAKQGVVLKGLIDALTTNKLNASALEPAIAQVLLDAQAQVNAHNINEESHADLRLLISDYYAVVKSLLDSDDETLNQTSEIVAYIKSNKSLIDAITTSKVNVLDIVDNLTTNASDKPLSAKQGVALKGMVDQLSTDKLSIAALSAAITQALTEAKNSGEFDGVPGISVTHSWNGTTLTVTSASGTSSANLRGANGKDYVLTESDKAEIAQMVIDCFGGQPVFGYVDENNIIIVSGKLADGNYSVKYEMEDGSTVDIGQLMLDTNVYYSVTKNLTYCSISNNATQVIEGQSYSATITANDGYTLKSVSVTMGGNAVSVSGGTINIAKVTGNIVITAVAEEQKASYTNQIPISIGTDGKPFNNGQGYKTGYRLSLSGGGESAQDGTEVTGFIPATKNSFLFIKDIAYMDDTIRGVVAYDADFNKTPTSTNGINLNTLFNTYGSDAGNGVRKSARLGSMANFKDGDNIKYIRLCSTDINENSILTVDEEIV